MSMPTSPKHLSWITHKGNKLLFYNIRSLSPKEILAFVPIAADFIVRLNDPNLRILVDSFETKETLELVKAYTISIKKTKAFHKKIAIIGVNKPKVLIIKTMVKITSFPLSPFANEVVAKDWLITD